MAQSRIYVESPFDRIVNVHFGAIAVIIAEVPQRLAALVSIDPDDPDQALNWQGIYDEGEIIPPSDYSTRPYSTTANIYIESVLIDGIAEVDALQVGKVYSISGEGIPSGSSMTYDGASAGTLSQPATLDALNTAVTIRLPILIFQVRVRLPSGPIWTTAVFRSEPIEYGDETYFNSPIVRFFGGTDAEQDAAYAELLLSYPADWLLVRDGLDPASYNGVPLVFPNGIYQIKGIESELSDVFLINMENTTTVRIDQLVYQEPNHVGQTGNFIPGYLPGGGTKLWAYPPGTQLSLDGGPEGAQSLSVTAIDPATDEIAPPSWTATIPPTAHPPEEPTEIARFNASGLI